MLDFIAYYAVKCLNKLFSIIPVSATLWLGRRFGTAAFLVNKDRRLVAYANLKSAFAKEKSPSELRSITKRVYQNMVQTFMEILNLTKVNKNYVDHYINVINYERIVNAAASGRGTILLTAHFGDWELSSLTSSVKGFPILVLVREQKMKRLNELLNQLRESNGCTVIRKGMDVKNILRALNNKKIVGILSDQDAGKNGMLVDFFGRPTSCHTGAFEIAKHTGSLILPNFNVRIKGPRHQLFLEEYIDFQGPDPAKDVKEAVQKFMHLLESYIRRYPDQWLWMHKRWKSTPTRTVLVLNDGKAGHLNQSLAVANAIRRARTTQGYGLDDTKIVIVDVAYKNRIARAFLALSASFAGWRCHGKMWRMKAALKPESYDALMKTYSEFVVSCGSSLAPVNVYMAKENNAKNIVVMDPALLMGLRQFALAVIPRHDAPPRCRNVVETLLAPNTIEEEVLRSYGDRLRSAVKLSGDKVIGLFIGGDNPEFVMTKEVAADVVSQAIKFCDRNGAELLVTTSRRTSPEVEAVVKEKLARYPKCRLLVIANEDNPRWTVGGILDTCKVAIVSGESISMVSEALTAGRKTIVFKLPKKTSKFTKHEKMLADLARDAYIATCLPRELDLAISQAFVDRRKPKEIRDRDAIFESVRRLV